MQNDNEANSAWGSLVLLGGAARGAARGFPFCRRRSRNELNKTTPDPCRLTGLGFRGLPARRKGLLGLELQAPQSVAIRNKPHVPAATPAMLLRLRLTKNTSAREEMSSHLKVLTVYQHRGNFILTIMSRRFHEVFEMFCKFIQNVRREYLTIFLIMNRTQQPS